jgi:membrane-bound lytic murein transglycosylase A
MILHVPFSRLWYAWIGFLLLVSLPLGCFREPAPPRAPYPVLTDDLDRASLQRALQQSLAYVQRLPSDRQFQLAERRVSAATLHATLLAFQELLARTQTMAALRTALQDQFEFVQATGRTGNGDVLFTGYYEPILRGSLVPTDEYTYPLYTTPADLLSVDLAAFRPAWAGQRLIARYHDGGIMPYYTRREIDRDGKLRGRDLELVWLRDIVEGFFLHIEGSGQIQLPNGHTMRVHYATSNGHDYRSIGRLLLDEGQIPAEAMSMQSLRQYLRAHPEEHDRILNHNPRYIFFHEVANGPLGNLGFPLTPQRSIALDSQLFPPAALAFIQTSKPLLDANNTVTSWQPFGRFVFNHDTGSAITGPGRVDLFWGSGSRAAAAAGRMQHPGTLFVLLKRTPASSKP